MYHPVLMIEFVRQGQQELDRAAAQRHATDLAHRRSERPIRAACGWALVEFGLRLVTAGADARGSADVRMCLDASSTLR